MVLTTRAASPSVTLFTCAISSPSPFVSEVPKQPKFSSPPIEEDITNAPSTPMVLVLSPGPVWAPFQLSLSTTSNLCCHPLSPPLRHCDNVHYPWSLSRVRFQRPVLLPLGHWSPILSGIFLITPWFRMIFFCNWAQ
ncbi:hypothetical protein DSO57_1011352 [Entomophthora muscae]|uniref:Uncharacterized protein n=1 Tax=Entomophthora muscae TaxID=34485 RepID=A0ACC2U415_9FUNG|nr:hypothetical protein DSO57_1011352 [Entomophthora muscae]